MPPLVCVSRWCWQWWWRCVCVCVCVCVHVCDVFVLISCDNSCHVCPRRMSAFLPISNTSVATRQRTSKTCSSRCRTSEKRAFFLLTRSATECQGQFHSWFLLLFALLILPAALALHAHTVHAVRARGAGWDTCLLQLCNCMAVW